LLKSSRGFTLAMEPVEPPPPPPPPEFDGEPLESAHGGTLFVRNV
jgi:hypothetical protein